MIKIDFNVPIVDLLGNVVPASPSLCHFYAEELTRWPTGDAKKFYAWALALSRSEPLVLDLEEAKLLREWINSSTNVIILVKGQALKIIDTVLEQSIRARGERYSETYPQFHADGGWHQCEDLDE